MGWYVACGGLRSHALALAIAVAANVAAAAVITAAAAAAAAAAFVPSAHNLTLNLLWFLFFFPRACAHCAGLTLAAGYGCYGTIGQGGGFGGFTWHRDAAPGTKVEQGYDGRGWAVYVRDAQIPPLHSATISGLRHYYGNAWCVWRCVRHPSMPCLLPAPPGLPTHLFSCVALTTCTCMPPPPYSLAASCAKATMNRSDPTTPTSCSCESKRRDALIKKVQMCAWGYC